MHYCALIEKCNVFTLLLQVCMSFVTVLCYNYSRTSLDRPPVLHRESGTGRPFCTEKVACQDRWVAIEGLCIRTF